MHVLLPELEEYRPISQSVHAMLPEYEYWPDLHSMHVVLLEAPESEE